LQHQRKSRAIATNGIKFESADIENAKGVGSISTLTFDIHIAVEPVVSDNPMAPTHRVLSRSRRDRLVECGCIWKKQNRDTGADYSPLSIRDFDFNANLGKVANQDDDTSSGGGLLGLEGSSIIAATGQILVRCIHLPGAVNSC